MLKSSCERGDQDAPGLRTHALSHLAANRNARAPPRTAQRRPAALWIAAGCHLDAGHFPRPGRQLPGERVRRAPCAQRRKVVQYSTTARAATRRCAPREATAAHRDPTNQARAGYQDAFTSARREISALTACRGAAGEFASCFATECKVKAALAAVQRRAAGLASRRSSAAPSVASVFWAKGHSKGGAAAAQAAGEAGAPARPCARRHSPRLRRTRRR